MKTLRAVAMGVALTALVPARAWGQTQPHPDVSWARDGAITTAALTGALLASLIPVDQTVRWQLHLLPIDRRLEGRLSESAARTSDVLLAVDVAMPFGLLIGQGGGFTDPTARQFMIYGETVAISVFLNSITKFSVGRPRPYVYSDDPRVRRYADAEGTDAYLSFYSGHASTAFAASVAGSYLYAQIAPNATARAGVWGFELALAGATADLRTRAGKHFYSDVLVGAIVGTGVGLLVPRLHGGPRYSPSSAEWIVIGTAPLAGVAIGELLPARPSTLELLTPIALPFVTPGGGGIFLAQAF